MIKHALVALSLLAVGSAFAAPSASFSNGSFEDSNVASGSYRYGNTPSGVPITNTGLAASPWTFDGRAGVSANSPAWGGTALDGSSYAFLQNISSISQTFSGLAGEYQITFSLAQRTSSGTAVGAQRINVFFDNQQLSLLGQNELSINPPAYTWNGSNLTVGGWSTYTFKVNALGSGNHSLSFNGLVTGVDTSVFLDKVIVTAPVPEPETYAMLAAGLGLMGFVARRRQRKTAA